MRLRNIAARISPSRLVTQLSGLTGVVSGMMCLVLMLLIGAAVFSRYVLQLPLSFALPLSQMFLVAILGLGIAYTLSVGGHIRTRVVEELLARLPLGKKQLSVLDHSREIFCKIVGLSYCSVLTWQAIVLFEQAYRQQWAEKSTYHFPLPPFYGILAGGALLLCLQYLVEIYRYIRQPESGPDSADRL